MVMWQVAAGDGSRDYSDVFLRFGVLLTGPGGEGPFDPKKRDYEDWPFIAATAEQVKDGDIVVLKRPAGKRWAVLAVGQVVGDYEWIESFEDVEGWDLQHARRVRWCRPEVPSFVAGLTRGTLRRVHKAEAKKGVLAVLEAAKEIEPDPIPTLPKPLADEHLIEKMIDAGLRVGAAEEVAGTIRRVRRLARWYQQHGRDVSEHETRTFLVIPLLLALGWPEQRLKVEWNRLDIALFDRPYDSSKANSKANLVGIVETKRLHEGLAWAEKQAIAYAKEHPTCAQIVVTDGMGYKLFEREDDHWTQTGSTNVACPRVRHPYLPEVGGAEKATASGSGWIR